MEEKWREVYTQEQLFKIQQIERRNLLVLAEVCEKLGIPFFLYGGSLIGAVRHQGFVPWDDDLDVAMLREDYRKFITEAPKLLPKEYCLQSPYTDKKTPYLYTKLRLRGTRYIEYAHHRIPMEQGIYVDIYPIDNLPDDDEAYLLWFRKFQRLGKLYVLRQSPHPSRKAKTAKQKVRGAAKWVLSAMCRILPQEYYIAKADQILTRYNGITTRRKGNLFYPKPKNIFYDLLPLENGTFEGIPVNLPRNWDKHLSARYGDYMQMPPEEERLGHRPYILDFGKY